MSNTTSTPDHAANTGYTPVFNDTVRTVVYIIGLVAVIVGLGVSTFGDPAVGDYITTPAVCSPPASASPTTRYVWPESSPV